MTDYGPDKAVEFGEHRDGLVSPLSPWAEWFLEDDRISFSSGEADQSPEDRPEQLHRPGIRSRDYEEGDSATHVRRAESFSAVVDIADRRAQMGDDEFPWNSFLRDHHSSLEFDHRGEDTGVETLPDAVELARKGWEDGLRLMQRISSQIKPDSIQAQNSPRKRVQYGVTGSSPSVPRALAGNPKAMRRRRVQESGMGKAVDIVVNGAYPYHRKRTEVVARGIAIASAMRALRTSGFSIGLTVVTHIESSNFSGKVDESGAAAAETMQYIVPVVEAGKPLSDATLLFATAHPSMLRRIMFAAFEEEPESIRRDFGFHSARNYGHVRGIVGNYEHHGPAVLIDAQDGFGLRTAEEIARYGQRLVNTAIMRMKEAHQPKTH